MNRLVLCTLGVSLVLASVGRTPTDLLAGRQAAAGTISVTLGEQDFNNGQMVGIVDYQNAQAGEPPPFDAFRGTDSTTGDTFDETWQFVYGPPLLPLAAASIQMGLYDHDSAEDPGQVASFLVNGVDLSSDLDALLEYYGGGTQPFLNEYNVYTLALPSSMLPTLAMGSTTVSLRLQNGYGMAVGTVPNNGAGLDFATLRLVEIPEPATVVLLLTAAAALLCAHVGRKYW